MVKSPYKEFGLSTYEVLGFKAKQKEKNHLAGTSLHKRKKGRHKLRPMAISFKPNPNEWRFK